MHDVLSVWQAQGIDFLSAREAFDTRTALGRLLLNLLASLAEFELEVLRERVKAGMERARRQGTRIGRPPAVEPDAWAAIEPLVRAGTVSRHEAARRLGVGRRTVQRLLQQVAPAGQRQRGVDLPERGSCPSVLGSTPAAAGRMPVIS